MKNKKVLIYVGIVVILLIIIIIIEKNLSMYNSCKKF